MNKYYYPINSTSLASIFGQACILPASLYKNRLSDIQNNYEDYILLTNHFGCEGSDCCLQIILTSEEEKSLIDIEGGFYLFENALPISRIQKIYFANAEQISRTITGINLSTAFIPKNIIDVNGNKFDDISIKVISIPEDMGQDMGPLKDKVKSSYEKYNRLLGAMALMRIARDEGCNFSPHYIDFLSKYNTLIKAEKKAISDIDISFLKIIHDNPDFINQNIDMDVLEKEAKEGSQIIQKNKITKVIDPSNLEKNTYVCYVLYDYGVGNESRRHKIDELILDNFNGLKKDYREGCAFYYGYNRGYAAFNNEYKKDNKTEIFKFQLNSLLDYYTIESLFEYCFYEQIPSKLDIIDCWVEPAAQRKIKRGEYPILDTIIRDKKKVALFSEEWWKNCLSYFMSRDDVTFMGYNFSSIIIEKVLKPFASLIKDELSDDFEEKLQKQIKSNAETVAILNNELSDCKDKIKELEAKQKEQPAVHEQEQSIQANTVKKADINNDIVYAKKVIKLYGLNNAELKEKAKELGCKVKTNTKKEDLIFEILIAEQRNNNLFS